MIDQGLKRREFLKVLGTTVAAASLSSQSFGEPPSSVLIAADPGDEIAASQPVRWAIDALKQALIARGVAVTHSTTVHGASNAGFQIIAAGSGSLVAQQYLLGAKVSIPAVPEALGLVAMRDAGTRGLLPVGRDARGLMYVLTDLADRVRNSPDPIAALMSVETSVEQPANEARSISRLFCSEVEDKPWFNDRAMWPEYFDMLATQRFNRFNLAFGIGYDFIRHVTDAYFLFTYPFLLKVAGYSVRVPQLADRERDSNLEMLRYISDQCVQRGLEFHVGLWMHGYEWIDSPSANYTIEGLNKDNHGPYCRDAVRMLLQQVPNISGITFRIHGESGVAEGSFDFWKTVFDGVATCGRSVQIDMHPKGMNQQMIDIALATKQPLIMSPKFWGEHMGMPYHQADIREFEKPKKEDRPGLMSMSEGTRSFMRYGYGDLLREDRQWKVVHRIWPGTQRVLLWGDPMFAATYSRAFQFCGSNGVEIMEPLSFKGRRGSGRAGSRCGYADASYDPRWDWQKYEYSTRVWGRLLYNPETEPEVWRRPFIREFAPGTEALESALASASRILPVVTTAHAPSAGNNMYWLDLYFNQSMVDDKNFEPYRDSRAPRVFGNASPFDPALFLSMNECAEELLAGTSSGRYSPLEVAQWIEDFAARAQASLAKAGSSARNRNGGAYKRIRLDVQIQAGLGEFFAAKFRSGVLFHIYRITGEQASLEAAIEQYKKARSAYAAIAEAAKGIYSSDVTFGEQPYLRGHWWDRIPAIDRDIALLGSMLKSASSQTPSQKVQTAINTALGRPRRLPIDTKHQPPGHFRRGEELQIVISVPLETGAVRLHYRHLNQAETYVTAEMERQGGQYATTIPGAYTKTDFPLEYFFEVRRADGMAGLYPGFTPELTNQPYFVVNGT
jgi:hypothetical protein